ncbi:MAG: DUF488 family protein [Gemmatimonadota bacterium]
MPSKSVPRADWVGPVGRPPRGVPKEEFASRDFYDVWVPNLAPSAETVKLGQGAESDREWKRFERAYRKEMKAPGPRHDLALLASLSHTTDFSVGCYCEEESRCHRSVLRELLIDNGAAVV